MATPKHWNKTSRKLFKETKSYILENQSVFCHPKMPVLEAEHWKTIAHNTAWMAADILAHYETK